MSDPYFVYVEDEPMSRMVMEMAMKRKLGYKNITVYEDGYDFLERLEQLPAIPDVIFLDIHMRPYDGFALLSLVRQEDRYQNTRVIALTASVMNEEVAVLQNAGFDGGISKPLDLDVFPRLLERILQGESVWYIG